MSLLYKILNKNIILYEQRVYFCQDNLRQVFSLSRSGIGPERLLSEILVLFLKLFVRVEEKGRVTVKKVFTKLEENKG